jgi:DNA-binding transcriptional ArsR family regulator
MSDDEPTPRGRRRTLRSNLGNFGVVNRAAIEACAGDTTALAVYAALATYADGDGACWPAQKTLAELIGVSEGTIRRAISRLEEVGLIEVDARLYRGRKVGNAYVLVIPDGSRAGARSGEPTDRALTRVPQTRADARSIEQDQGTSPNASDEPKRERPRNPLFDAVVEVCNLSGEQTRTSASFIGKTVRELKDAGATPEEIRARAARWRGRYRIPLTPGALLKHWPALARGARRDEPLSQEEVAVEEARRREWLEAHGMTEEQHG